MKLNAVIYTLCITQLMNGAYQVFMQGVGVFREIITGNSLFTDTSSLSNSSTGSSLSSGVIMVREMWFA